MKRKTKTYKIGAHDWTVQYLPPHEMDPPEDESLERNATIGRHYTHYGSMIPGDLLILVNNTLASSMTAETEMHEVIHALLELTGARGLIKHGREEELTQALGHGLTQVLRDNPGFRRLFNNGNGRRRT